MTAQRFLVPVDFSVYADQAVEYAIRLAGKLDARLTLLHVIQPLPWGDGGVGAALPYPYSQALEAEITRCMQGYLAQMAAAGIDGEMAVVHGVPFQEIVATARLQQVDLIVMGTHGRTGLPHVLLGSVAEKVVRLAPCPVLVVRQSPSVSVS